MSEQQEPFIEAVGPWPQAPDTGVADQTPTPDVDDATLQAQIEDALDAEQGGTQ
jgi:hypothetical protein